MDLLRVSTNGFEELDQLMYVPCCTCDAVCKINMQTKNVSVLFVAPEERLGKNKMWGKTARIGKKLAIAPYDYKKIIIYDMELGKVLFELKLEEVVETALFYQVIAYENNFYFMGYRYPGILKISVDTFEAKYLTEWISKLYTLGNSFSIGDYYIADGYVQSGSCFYFPTGKDAKLLKIDCKKDEIQLIEVPCQCEKFVSIAGTGAEIWLVDFTDMYESHKVIVWNRITNYLETVELNYKGCWHAPIFYNENVYLFPMNTDGRVLKIHRNTMKVSVFEELDILFRDKYGRIANVMTVKQHDKEVTFIRRPDYTWFTYNFETGELKEEIYTIDDSEFIEKYNAEKNACYDKIYEKAINVGNVIYEEDIPLKEFLERI